MRAFLVGLAALAVAAYAVAAAIGVTADARGWESFDVGVGPLTLLRFERAGTSTSFELGAGLLLVALAGAVVNALAALLLRRSRR